jgi:hypothetical protein
MRYKESPPPAILTFPFSSQNCLLTSPLPSPQLTSPYTIACSGDSCPLSRRLGLLSLSPPLSPPHAKSDRFVFALQMIPIEPPYGRPLRPLWTSRRSYHRSYLRLALRSTDLCSWRSPSFCGCFGRRAIALPA